MRGQGIIGSGPLQAAHWYFLFDSDEKKARAGREKYRKILMDYITENGAEDEDGHVIWEFPEPMNIEDVWYTGFKIQRRVSEYADEDRAKELIELHGLEDRCLVPVTEIYIDYDELYAANQEGIITDDEIDSILGRDITWALTKVKQ